MSVLHTNEMAPQEIYRALIGSVVPRPIILLTTLNADDTVNLAPFSFYNMVSYQPPLLMVSIQRQAGKLKDTARNLLRSREAVGHVVTRDMLVDTNATAASLPYGESELSRTAFQLARSETVAVPHIATAPIYYELQLHTHHVITQADGQASADVFYLSVQAIAIADSVRDGRYIDATKLDAVSRLAGQDYATIGDILSYERPQ